MRYFVYLSYKGTNYHGWQIQPNAITIQEILNNSFSLILKEKIELTGAGRTDTGVHASYFVAHFDLFNEIRNTEDIVFKLNRFLPKDIAISKIIKVKPNIHSRFDAVSRSYEYHISIQKNPYDTEFTYPYYSYLNIKNMNDAAKILYDFNDFTSFSKLHTDNMTNICNITEAFWIQNEKELIFKISADRFLRNMVRAIVGTLLNIGMEKQNIDDFIYIIENKNRKLAGQSAPPQGLFLTNISYPDNIFENKTIAPLNI